MRRRILFFDSGMGGLTVARAVATELPDADLVYSADTAGFPYGAWTEASLTQRIIRVLTELIDRVRPDVVVIACNTASTLAMIPVRRTFSLPFVGTVPAIKPAAAATKSNIVGVLATPGTVSREYTQLLVKTYAGHCKVVLHGAPRLAELAERFLGGEMIDDAVLRAEINPVFVEEAGARTDVVVLGCTHYPLLVDSMRRVAPWDVEYIDPAPAIARRVAFVLEELGDRRTIPSGVAHGTVFLTSHGATDGIRNAYREMGFSTVEVVNLPV
jgi:glutamate racemase